MPPTPPDQFSAEPSHATKPPISRLAIVGFVLAVVPGCPLICMTGALIGMFSWQKINRSQGRMGGKRLAIAATIIGASASFVWASVWQHYVERMEEGMREAFVMRAETFLAEAAAGRTENAIESWAIGIKESLTEEQIESFSQELRDRYGPLKRISITSHYIEGVLDQEMIAACSFEFEDASLFGAIQTRLTTVFPLTPDAWLTRIKVEDRELGDLELPIVPPQDETKEQSQS